MYVDALSIGVGSIVVQVLPEGKRKVSFNSRIYTEEEQKLSSTARELCGVISDLQSYGRYSIGSPHPVYVHRDQKPLMCLWGRRKNFSHRFFRYQLLLSQFKKSKSLWTKGKNLAFPDTLSGNVEIEDFDRHQLTHKKTKNISFCDRNVTRKQTSFCAKMKKIQLMISSQLVNEAKWELTNTSFKIINWFDNDMNLSKTDFVRETMYQKTLRMALLSTSTESS